MSDAAVDNAVRAALLEIPGLSGMAPGGVHNGRRPQGSAFPVVVFQYIGPVAPESPRYGAKDGQEYHGYQVRVIAPVSLQAGVGLLLAAIHERLQGAVLSIAGVDCMPVMRHARIPNLPETVNGVEYLSRGATYKVSVSHPA